MRRIVLTAALVGASAFFFHAYAQEYLEGYITHTRMTELSSLRYQESLENMNHTYDVLAEMLDQTGKRKLGTAQSAWRKFSEAECVFETDYSRGEPLEKLIYQDCLISMNEKRKSDLEYQLRRNYTVDPSLATTKGK